MFILYNFVSISLHILLGLIELNKLLETQLQACIKDHCPWLTAGTWWCVAAPSWAGWSPPWSWRPRCPSRWPAPPRPRCTARSPPPPHHLHTRGSTQHSGGQVINGVIMRIVFTDLIFIVFGPKMRWSNVRRHLRSVPCWCCLALPPCPACSCRTWRPPPAADWGILWTRPRRPPAAWC